MRSIPLSASNTEALTHLLESRRRTDHLFSFGTITLGRLTEILRWSRFGAIAAQPIGRDMREPSDTGSLTLGKAILWGATVIGWWGFGIWGFYELYFVEEIWKFAEADRKPDGLDVFYDTLSLVTVYLAYATDPVPINWQIQVARISAAGFLGVSAFLVFAERLRDAMRRAISQIWRGHTVIIGLSPENRALIADLLRRGGSDARIVAIDPTAAADGIEVLRRQNVVILTGDPADPGLIRGANMAHAAHVAISMESDSTNLELLSRLRLRLKTKYSHQRIHVQVEDDLLRRRLKEQESFISWPEIGGDERVRVDLYSTSSLAASRLFADEPLAAYADWRGQPQMHIVIVGFGATGEAILLSALQQGLYKDLGTPKITVIDRQAEEREATFRARYPAIPWLGESPRGRYAKGGPAMTLAFDISFINANIDQLNCRDPEFLETVEARGPVTAVVVAVGTDEANLSTALALRHALGMHHAWGAPIYVRIKEDGGLVDSLNSSHSERDFDRIIQAFGTVAKLCIADEILHRVRSGLAESLHLRYLDRTAGEQPKVMAEKTERAFGDWPDIKETYRDANRSQAEHVPLKLRAAGLSPISEFFRGKLENARAWGVVHGHGEIGSDSQNDIFAPKRNAIGDADDIDSEKLLVTFAQLEHRRWMTDRLIDGWIYGPNDDPVRKFQPDLIDFEFLDGFNLELDIGHIRDLPILIKDLQPHVDWVPDVLVGVVGPIHLSASELQRVEESVRDNISAFCDDLERRTDGRTAITLLSTLAPGSDCAFVSAAADVFAERKVPYRITAPRPLPFDLYTEDLQPDVLGEDGAALQKQFADVRSSPALQWTFDLAEPGDDFFELGRDKDARERMYRRANAYIVERADILYVVRRADRDPGRHTAEALSWRRGTTDIPSEFSSYPAPRHRSVARRVELIEI